MSTQIDIFTKLPILWKIMIFIGIITVIILLLSLLTMTSLMFYKPKLDISTNIDDYANIIEEFDKDEKQNLNEKYEKYPELPKIKDLNGNIMKDLMSIDII